MRHFFLIAGLASASGCALPVLTSDEAFGPCTVSEWLPARFPTIVGLGKAELAIAGCIGDMTLTGPHGEPVPIETSGWSVTRVLFTATSPGRYILRTSASEATFEVSMTERFGS